MFGSTPNDNGNLILNDTEKNELINKYPVSKKFILQLLGAEEFQKNSKMVHLA